MIKKLSPIFFLVLSGVMASVNSFAGEAEKEHVPVGQRSELVQARTEQLETRAKMSALYSEDSSKPKNTSVAKSMSSTKMRAAASVKSLYYTCHPDAYQNPVSISYDGDNIELTDGSVWIITSCDAYKVVNWFPTDLVIITPNHSWFSSYLFRITNQNTGESVAANLSLGPIDPVYGSFYTHWIVAIDYCLNIVHLEDGSIWNMSQCDSHILNQWMQGDVVIIGVNDSWLSSNPNILINVAMLNFAAGATSF